MGNIITINTENKEYVSVCRNDNGKIILQVGYSEAELNKKQVDSLICALKEV